MQYADSSITRHKQEEEIVHYNKRNLTGIVSDKQDFFNDPFSAVKFWYDRRYSFPQIFLVGLRGYGTPVGCCASERVFSLVKSVLTKDRNRPTASNLENIIVTHSLCSE